MISGRTARVAYRYCYVAVLAAICALVLSGCNGLGSSSTVGTPDTTPPTAPAGLTATATLATQINLSWTASTDNVGVTGYKLERCSGAGCANFAQVATPALTAFNDSGLTASTLYSYRVRASDAAGNNSAYSNVFSATTPVSADTTPPIAPANLTATAASTTQINLSWTASTDNVGVTGYKVERCSGVGCTNFVQIATPTAITFNDTGLTASTSYSYRVRANDATGNNSGYSNVGSATTPAAADTTPPTAPTNLTATAVSTTHINLSWTASTDNIGVTGYKVERCSGAACANFVQIATPTGTTFNDTGLAASTSYSYRVRTNDAAGNNSGYSNTASATTLAAADTTPPSSADKSRCDGCFDDADQSILDCFDGQCRSDGIQSGAMLRGRRARILLQMATPTGTTFNDTGLTASTSYSYRVRANDAAGNNSGYSNTATATTQAASSGNISVTISPKRGGLTLSQTMPFTATVTNDVGAAGVTWTASSGSFSTQSTSAATFVAPNSAGVVTVTATSVADVTKSASATIGVTDLAGVFTYHNDLSRDGVNAQ